MHSLTGEGNIVVTIRAYNANGELEIGRDPFTLGTRVLLTCDVTGITEGNEAVSYRWFRNCTGGTDGQCEIRDGHPYYRLVKDTLLMDITDWDQGGKYKCFVGFNATPVTGNQPTPKIALAG